MIVKIKDCKPQKKDALGATLAEQHMAVIQRAIDKRMLAEGELVILDFSGIRAVNGSYIKGTAYWLFLCGQFAARRKSQEFPVRHPADPRPCDIFVAAAGLATEVEEEFIDFFRIRQMPLIIADQWDDGTVISATLEGHLDGALRTTLMALVKKPGGSAPQLHAEFPKENISVTAWNNRLSDLNALRLVRRTRSGKLWQYEPIARKITYGRSIH